nr:3-hydroxyacyl-CoA dehydrogenase NAD-binding domain-containing protein [Spelaeicoccus albus]
MGNENMDNIIRWSGPDSDGIVTLTIDDPTQKVNTMNDSYRASMHASVERLESERDSISGVVLTSAKSSFFAGGDLKQLSAVGPADAAALTETVQSTKADLRRLETLGVPVVAALNGAALGGGLEIALAAHHRIAADVPGAKFGFPEVGLGLLPGGGGIVRTVRMIGIVEAVSKILATGKQFGPAAAKDAGLIDDVVPADRLIDAARDWIAANPGAVQPWDVPGFRIPGGTAFSGRLAADFPGVVGNVRKQVKGANMPAPKAILAAAGEGALVDFDTAALIETRYFVHLLTGQVAHNMIRAFFFDAQAIKAGKSRPDGFEKYTARKVGVIGAGMMGAAIAYVSAKAGIDVVLKDVSDEAAAKGKAYAESLEQKALAAGKTTEEKSAALLGRITPSGDPSALAGVDFVIEAVFESVEVKHAVFAELEPIVQPDAVLGSNTSSLPITTLAEGVSRQEDFIGIHFFSPVDKMPLVEIIRGANTSDAVLAKTIDFAMQIHKTPIVVNDSRGFFTSRVIGGFVNEAMAALAAGVEPAAIEQAGLQAGYPAPPLQLMDELTLTLPRKIRDEGRQAERAAGREPESHASDVVIDRMLDEFGRTGRSGGAGFYEYFDGKRVRLWPGLRQAFGSGSVTLTDDDFVELQERMLFAESLDTVRCFDEGVLMSYPDANLGSILGIGFPAWTGGVLQYINQYKGGLAGFVARADDLAGKYGPQFDVPQSLRDKAAAGEVYE